VPHQAELVALVEAVAAAWQQGGHGHEHEGREQAIARARAALAAVAGPGAPAHACRTMAHFCSNNMMVGATGMVMPHSKKIKHASSEILAKLAAPFLAWTWQRWFYYMKWCVVYSLVFLFGPILGPIVIYSKTILFLFCLTFCKAMRLLFKKGTALADPSFFWMVLLGTTTIGTFFVLTLLYPEYKKTRP